MGSLEGELVGEKLGNGVGDGVSPDAVAVAANIAATMRKVKDVCRILCHLWWVETLLKGGIGMEWETAGKRNSL